MGKTKKITLITDMALFVSLGFILDFIQGFIGNFLPFWPNGGSVGISLIATLIFSYRHGIYGLLCGFLTGLLSMLGGIWISPFANNPFHVFMQLGLDYFISWTVVGFAGIFAKKISNSKHKLLLIIVSSLIAGFSKYFCHFLAGMIYWPSEDVTSQFIYSLSYNGSYMIPTIILSTIFVVIIYYKVPFIINYKYETEIKSNKNRTIGWGILTGISSLIFLISTIFFILSITIYRDLEASYGEVFSSNDNYLFFMILSLFILIVSLIFFVKNLRKKSVLNKEIAPNVQKKRILIRIQILYK